ncbi:MAG: FecCD family ABC transporter permease [Planctomycetaceae bacterium]
MNRPIAIFCVCFVAMVACAVISLGVGAVPIHVSKVVASLFEAGSSLDSTSSAILVQLRLPRVLSACLVGASLGAAGVGFQGLFRNPLADPYIIGASSGAGLGATLAVIGGLQIGVFGLGGIAIAALLGSIGAVAIVFAIGSLSTDRSPLSLLLAGVALSSMINAIVSLLMFLNDEKIVVILSWLMGSLAGNDWQVVRAATVSTAMGVGLLWILARPMDANLLGEQAAQSLGLDLIKFRVLVVAAASIATAAAVSAAGIIGFVGLIAPHIAGYLVGPRHLWLVPTSGCIGAIILLVSDALARTVVAPAELPVGIVTALLGCPFFLVLLKTRSSRGGMPA